MSAYMIAALNIEDAEGYSKYVAEAVETLKKFGAEPLALSYEPLVLEGDYPLDLFVLVKFRDLEHLQSWYNSPEYVEARQVRFRTAKTSYLMAVEGMS